MKVIFKNNAKLILGFALGTIITATIAVYATINANTVDYTNNKKVSDALNELYNMTVSSDSNKCKVLTNYTLVCDGTNYTLCNLGFQPTFVFIDAGDEGFYWKGGTTIYYVNPSASRAVVAPNKVQVSSNGFSYRLDASNNGNVVTIYAVE